MFTRSMTEGPSGWRTPTRSALASAHSLRRPAATDSDRPPARSSECDSQRPGRKQRDQAWSQLAERRTYTGRSPDGRGRSSGARPHRTERRARPQGPSSHQRSLHPPWFLSMAVGPDARPDQQLRYLCHPWNKPVPAYAQKPYGIAARACARTGAEEPRTSPPGASACASNHGPVPVSESAVSNPPRETVLTGVSRAALGPASRRRLATWVAPFQLTYPTGEPPVLPLPSTNTGLDAGCPVQGKRKAR